MSGKRYVFRGDNGWNDLLHVKHNQQVTIIPEAIESAPAPLQVPATEEDANGWDSGIQVSTNQTVKMVAEGKWQGENATEWEHTFQFDTPSGTDPHTTYGDGGWQPEELPDLPRQASYTANTCNGKRGWATVPNTYQENNHHDLTIIMEFDETFITEVVVNYDISGVGSPPAATGPNLYTGGHGGTRVGGIHVAAANGRNQKLTLSTGVNADTVSMDIFTGSTRGCGVVNSITIKGKGTNPFDPFNVRVDSNLVGPEGAVGTSAPAGFKLTGAEKYALLYRIGTSGNWTKVGASTTLTPQTSGRLYLAMNDNDYSDNAGHLQVYVDVIGRPSGNCDDRIDSSKPPSTFLYQLPQVDGTQYEITGQQVTFIVPDPSPNPSTALQITRNGCDTSHYAVRVIVDAPDDPANQNQACDDCDDGVNAAGQPCSDNPIQLKDGTKVQSFTDLAINAPNRPLTFTRRYNQAKLNTIILPFMGVGWSHNHHYNLTLIPGTPNKAEITLPDGGTLKLTQTGHLYQADAGSTATFAPSGSHYVLTLPNRSTLTFNNSGQLLRRSWANGDQWTYTYISRNLNTVSDDYGNQLTFAYYSGETGTNAYKNGQLKTITDHTSRTVTLDYLTEKLNGTVVDPDGTGPLQPRPLLAAVTDVRGETWTYDYYGQNAGQSDTNQQSFLTKRQSPQVDAGTADGVINLEELGYTLSGSTITDINQKRGDGLLETDFSFQPTFTEQVAAKVHALKTVHHFANGVYVGAANPLGHVTSQVIGDDYRPVAQQDANGNSTQITWSADGRQITTVVDAEGNQTTFTYDNQDRLTRSTDVRGYTTTFTYGTGRQATEIRVHAANDTLLNLQQMDYDSRGRVTEERLLDPANPATVLRKVKRTYHATNGLLAKVERIGGAENPTTEYSYDPAGRVILTRQSSLTGNCEYSHFVYDAAGNVLATVCGRQQLATSPTTVAAARAAFDSDDPAKFTVTVHQYDELGRPIKTITNAGNPLAERTQLVAYDTLSRVTRVVENYVVQTGLDPYTAAHAAFDHGHEDNHNLVTDIAYNERGLVRQQTDVLGNVSLLGYDAGGRLIKVIQNAAKPNYNNAYRGTSPDPTLANYGTPSTTPDQDLVTAYAYDAVGNRIAAVDPLRRVTYTVYDRLNRVVKTVANAKDTATLALHPGDTNYNPANDPRSDHYLPDPATDRDLIQTQRYDALGRLHFTQDVLDRILLSGYDDLNRRVLTVGNYLGSGLHDPAQPDLNLLAQSIYDAAGQLARSIDPRHNETRYTYDDLGQPTQVIRNYVDGVYNTAAPDQDLKTTFTYDGNGNLQKMVDPAGVETYHTYDHNGRLTRTVRNHVQQGTIYPDSWRWNAARKRWEYASNSQVDQGTQFDQNLVTETLYDGAGRVASIRDERGTLTRFGYDVLGRRISLTQAASTHITCYDRAGRVLRTIHNYHPIPARTGVPADPAGNILPTARDKDGNWYFNPRSHGPRQDQNLITRYQYDALGRITQVTDPAGNTTKTTYFKDGQVETLTDPKGVQTLFRYDQARRRNLVVAAYRNTTQYADPATWQWDETGGHWQDGSGTPITHGTDRDENIVVQAYHDKAGRLFALREPLGRWSYFAYDKLNRPALQVLNYVPQPAGGPYVTPEQWAWDGTQWELPAGTAVDHHSGTGLHVRDQNLIRKMTYANVGHATRSTLTDGKGLTTTQDYDRLGRLTSLSYGDPTNTYDVDFAYDGAGNPASMSEYNHASHATANRQRETTYRYDHLRRLTQVNQHGQTVRYAYDAAGNRTLLTLPDNNTIAYHYDAVGQLIGLTDPDNQHSDFHYDGVGRHVGTQRPNGLLSDYAYDPASRLRRVQHHADGSLRALFAYELDANGNRTRAYEKVAQSTTVTATYNKSSSQVTFPRGTWTDAGDFKQTAQFSGRMQIAYTGDEALLTIGTGPDHGQVDLYINDNYWRRFDAYTAQPGERVLHLPQVPTPPGATSGVVEIRNQSDRHHRSTGRVFRFKQVQVLAATYHERTIDYTYDQLQRLKSAQGTPPYTYTYDQAGNRLSAAVGTNTTNFTYNKANQLVSDGTHTYTYDLNGNLTHDGTNAYTWNRANRLTQRGTDTYTYDGLGNRVSQTVNNATTHYLLDLPLDTILTATTGTNTDHFIHTGAGIHSHKQTNGTWHWLLEDGLGSIRAEIDNLAMVSAAQNYAPYGAPFGTVGTFASPYAYTGEYTDPSGQVYLRARYYNPAIGTFTALDPVMGVAAVPMSLNGYSYVHNNPVNWTDPSGEFLPVIAVIGLGILGGAVGGALLGGGIEAGSQLLNNGFDLGCLDMDSVGRAALEGAALGALAGGVGAAVGAAGLSGAAAFAVSEGADFIGGFLYDIGVNGMSREEALINGLMGIGFGGAIGLLGRGISRAARNINLPNNLPLPRQLRRQCASFSADTLITTPDGDKPISEIEVGDVILAYSEATEEVDIYHVSATHTQRHDTTLDITIDGETLHTTDEHPFYVIRDDQEQWVQAKHLHIGDAILSALGETGIVEDIVIVDEPQTMYNLTVSLVATYLVGDGQWLVHNQGESEVPLILVSDAEDYLNQLRNVGMDIALRNPNIHQHPAALTQGFKPRSPGAEMTIFWHVRYGSNAKTAARSPYISLSRSLERTIHWNQGLPIYVLDLNIVEDPVFDLSIPSELDRYIPDQSAGFKYEMARRFARSSKEVLVLGNIPSNAIKCLIDPE